MRVVAVIAFVLGLTINPAAAADDGDGSSAKASQTDEAFTATLVRKGNDKHKGGLAGRKPKKDPQPGTVPAKRTPLPDGAITDARECASITRLFENSAAPDPLGYCNPEPDRAAPASAGPELTLGHIRRAFARLKLPAGRLIIQPPDGLTLVNFDTNFYTTNTKPISRTVTLLGQRVTLQATPHTFTWHFGDDTKLATTDPGAAYPDLRVTHNYLRKDTYSPSLDTTYTGRFRIGNGPWRQIPGTVTIDGNPQSLRAIEASPKLVGY